MTRRISLWGLLPTCVVAFLALAVHSARSQDAGLSYAFSSAIKNTNPPPGPSSLSIFSSPIAVPNDFRRSNAFLKIDQLDRIPTPDGQPGERSVYDALRTARDQVQIGRKRLNAQETKGLRDAETFLYSDPTSRKPTPEYVAYAKYKAQSDAIKEKLAQPALGAADRSGLIAQLRSMESDWRLYGYRTEVDQRLEIARRYGENVTKALFEDWSDILSAESSLDVTTLDAAFGRFDWARVSFNGKAYGLSIALSSEGASTAPSDQIAISFDYIIVSVRRRALEHPFLADVGWRLKSGKVLSDGSKADSDTELLPRYYSHVVLAKNIELVLPVNMNDALLDALGSTKSVTVSGLTFDTSGSGLRFQGRYVSLVGPYLLGAIMTHVPKMPNPESERTWP